MMHLIQHRQAPHVGHAHFIPQLVKCVQDDMMNDFQRYACDSTFNMPTHEETGPTRQLLVQHHLQFQCPVLQQLSYLLSGHDRFGSANSSGTSRPTDEGSLRRSGHTLPKRKTSHDRGEGAKKRQKQTGSEPPTQAPPDNAALLKPRDGAEQSPLTRYFNPAPVAGQGGNAAHLGDSNREVEKTARSGDSRLHVFNELISRFDAVQKASQLAPPNNQLWTTLRSKNLVLEDGSRPT